MCIYVCVNALRMSVVERENISPIILAHTVTIWICTWLQRVIAGENSTACEGHLMLLCLALSIIRLGSRVKQSNPEKEIAPSLPSIAMYH